MNKNISLKTLDNYKISSVHTISDGKAILLWLHGITVDKNEYLNFFKDGADFFSSIGFDSLRIDFRGHGKSSGASKDFTVIGQMLDLECSVRYLNNFYDLEKTNLHMIGCSFGAPPAIFSAKQYKDKVKTLTLIAPVLSYERTFLKPTTQWAKALFNNLTMDKLYKTGKLYFNDKFCVGLRLIEEMKLIKPNLALLNVTQKTQIIHGDSDTMVPYEVSKEISTLSPRIILHTMEQMDHGFTDINDDVGNSPISQKNKKKIFELIKNQIQ